MGFFVRASTKGFRVIEEVWTPERKEQVVPREAYHALGFSFEMTLEEARARAKQINAQTQLESRKVAKAARRIALANDVESAYLPADMVAKFEAQIEQQYEDNEERFNNVIKQWNVVRRMIGKLALDPKDFFEEKVLFNNYFRTKAWSPDYIKKLTHVLNSWGHFVSRKRNTHFQPLPRLSNVQIQKIQDIRENKPGLKKAADPITSKQLNDAKSTFEHEELTSHWNWMFIGLHFGLRPKEIDGLHRKSSWKLERDSQAKVDVLSVYQTKLTSVSKDKRWKIIPVFTKEQKQAIALIQSGDFKRPLNKTLARLIAEGIQTYSPRKGFTDLMLEKGFSLEDISTFLGHNSIEMTWKHYKSRKRFSLPDAG